MLLPKAGRAMALNFPNASRSYDSTRRAVRFWGYDSAMETSFFVLADALRHVRALHAALQQRVDDDHVRLELAHCRHGPIAGRDHVEHLDLRLRLQERSHVRRDLRHVFDHQEPDLLSHASSTLVPAACRGAAAPSTTRVPDHRDPALTGRREGVQIVRAIDELDRQIAERGSAGL